VLQRSLSASIFLGMGGVDTSNDRIQSVTFPGVVVNLNAPGATVPPTGGSVGSVVNHVGFIVKNKPRNSSRHLPPPNLEASRVENYSS